MNKLPRTRYVFFWRDYESNGIFSRLYSCNIIENNITFSCAEQYLLYHKALLFDDFDTAEKILETKNPYIMQTLGLEITGFNESVWNSTQEEIMYRCLYLKFTQDMNLYKILLKYPRGTTFVEANPYDKINGIGYTEKNAIYTRSKWGKNLFGKAIGKVKRDLLSMLYILCTKK